MNIASFRLQLPRYENSHSWLSSLLDCYAIIDFSVSEAIAASGQKTACGKGCTACCYHVIPLSTIEVMGLKFYVQTMLKQGARSILLKNFREHRSICLFNSAGGCLVYPFRPIACRRYVVCSQSCAPDEDPTVTRPQDVLQPSRELLYTAVKRTFHVYHAKNARQADMQGIADFYKKNNLTLSTVYDKILDVQLLQEHS